MDKETARNKAIELVAKMTTEEKISQLVYNSPAIERLGINEYNWWNEALHGVARSGTATVFPQAIGLAATFNPDLVRECAEVISTEARAKYNKNVEYGDRDIYKGLTFWSPNINIDRDPRWGRGHETYGEDPFLTATIGCEFIKGIQGEGEFYKASACSKHYCVHSGPEKLRHGSNAKATKKDMEETYLPAFQKTVEAGVSGVMGAYNRINGVPACANEYLIKYKLRSEWSFDGYVVSDCGAINDIYVNHCYTETKAQAAAISLKAGCDLNCGQAYASLYDAYEEDLVDDEDITRACERLFTIRFLLGEFEEKRPYSNIGYENVDCEEHKRLNLKAAEQSVVLLKNEDNFLPLDADSINNVGVVGPNALSLPGLVGNYEGKASEYITPADGIRKIFKDSRVRVAQGSKYTYFKQYGCDDHENMLSDGVAVASVSDVTVLCLGLCSDYEGEGDTGDKEDIKLPEVQRKLAEAVCDVCKNVIVVIMCGSSLDIGETVRNKAKAILYAWYPGSVGGLAIAEILAGKVNPCGRLPVTIYNGNTQLPDFTDYSMENRTYRFINEKPLYPFGFGLSYSKVKYLNANVDKFNEKEISFEVSLKNDSDREVNEKVQVYARYTDSKCSTPNYQLIAIKSVLLKANKTAFIQLTADTFWLKAVTEEGKRKNPDGLLEFYIGSSQPDERSVELGVPKLIKLKIK